MITISTHNGSQVSHEHNIRNRKVTDKESHIDRNGHYEIWFDESVRHAYHRLFDESVREYNERQTREERRIENYYSTVEKSATQHPVYEMIAGVYCTENETDPEIVRQILKQYVCDWKKKNRNLELIGAYYHADEEGQAHVHIDYVPIAHGYTRGMKTQTGLVRALKELGFETKSSKLTAQMQWEKYENHRLEKLCKERGYIVTHLDEKRAHIETKTFEAMKELEKVQKQLSETKSELNTLEETKQASMVKIEALQKRSEAESKKIDELIQRNDEFFEKNQIPIRNDKPKTNIRGQVLVEPEVYEKLTERAQLIENIETEKKEVEERLRKAKAIEERLPNIIDREEQLKENENRFWDIVNQRTMGVLDEYDRMKQFIQERGLKETFEKIYGKIEENIKKHIHTR